MRAGQWSFDGLLGVDSAEQACGTRFPGSQHCTLQELELTNGPQLIGALDVNGAPVASFWADDPSQPVTDRCGLPGSNPWESTASRLGIQGSALLLDGSTGALTAPAPAHCFSSHNVACCSVPAAPPAAGDLEVTEIMANPAAASDAEGEWIELFNSSGRPVDLAGCELRDAAGVHVLSASSTLVVGASSFAVLSYGAVGLTPDYVYSDITLDNAGDSVTLSCSGTIVAEESYVQAPSGSSLQRDDSGAWCSSAEAAAGSFGLGDIGIPGGANPDCP